MTYRTILLELLDDPQNDARIECARRLAQRFDAELVGIHVSPPPFLPMGFGEGAAYVGPEVFEAQREANRLVRERVEASFRRLCDPARMAVRDIYEEGDAGELLAEAARGADLTILAQEGGSGLDALAPQPIHHVILSAGGPVLVLPRAGLADPQSAVGWSWPGTARARPRAPPRTRCRCWSAAEAVTLLAAGEDAVATLDAGANLLKRHGAKVTARQIELGRGRTGPCCSTPLPPRAPISWSWAPTGIRGCARSCSAVPPARCYAARG